MFKKMTAATLVLSGLLISSVSHAADSAVELHLESVMSDVINATNMEVSYGVQEAILTANNMIGTENNEDLFAATVTITDLNDRKIALDSESFSAE